MSKSLLKSYKTLLVSGSLLTLCPLLPSVFQCSFYLSHICLLAVPQHISHVVTQDVFFSCAWNASPRANCMPFIQIPPSQWRVSYLKFEHFSWNAITIPWFFSSITLQTFLKIIYFIYFVFISSLSLFSDFLWFTEWIPNETSSIITSWGLVLLHKTRPCQAKWIWTCILTKSPGGKWAGILTRLITCLSVSFWHKDNACSVYIKWMDEFLSLNNVWVFSSLTFYSSKKDELRGWEMVVLGKVGTELQILHSVKCNRSLPFVDWQQNS